MSGGTHQREKQTNAHAGSLFSGMGRFFCDCGSFGCFSLTAMGENVRFGRSFPPARLRGGMKGDCRRTAPDIVPVSSGNGIPTIINRPYPVSICKKRRCTLTFEHPERFEGHIHTLLASPSSVRIFMDMNVGYDSVFNHMALLGPVHTSQRQLAYNRLCRIVIAIQSLFSHEKLHSRCKSPVPQGEPALSQQVFSLTRRFDQIPQKHLDGDTEPQIHW